MTTPKISICIPYHAGLGYLRRCLASIRQNPPRCDHEIIIVEDASPEPCSRYVDEHFPGCRVLATRRNIGFSGAANLAIDAASGRYLLLLNPDTEVSAGALDALAAVLDARPEVGAVGPMLLNQDGTFQPQCKRGRLTPWSGLAYSLGLDRLRPSVGAFTGYMRRSDDIHKPCEVEALCGSCMMLRPHALDAVGLFDERMFLYGEDLDLCYRLAAGGWTIAYCPDARVVHVGGEGGSQRQFLRSQYHYHRSLVLLLRKFPPNRLYPVYGWAVAWGLALRFLIMCGAHTLGRRRIGSSKLAGRPITPPAREANSSIQRTPNEG